MRSRLLSLCLAAILTVGVGAACTVLPPGPGPAPGAPATPKCTFNGSALPLVTGVSAGETIAIACTGLAPNRPHLLFQASLLIGLDSQAKALLSGNSGLSPVLFKAALATVQKIMPTSITPAVSNSAGNLNVNYKVPSVQALDANASCPPSQQQFNSGLLGCALALLDLTTQKPVGAGSAVLQYDGFPLLPPQPTVALSNIKARAGKVVYLNDAPGHSTYWWVPTLGALNSMLSGDATGPTITVTVGSGIYKQTAPSYVVVKPATYTKPVFTPPTIAGAFGMPKKLPKGVNVVTVTLVQPLLGLPLVNVASTTIKRV